ncbi:hypothetical protein HBI18_155110 [Parastagonospora nodorum]|nr:hypothetical protein HBH77_096160 [Parastagonospora nodorum]KAH5720800.1 hypothetical protein HBI18_155110 [Parastagonospora nodorum]
MSVTFGAVGDIIAVVLVVKDLIDALDKASGSKVEYQAAIRELGLLERSLLEIDLFVRRHGDGVTSELQGVCELAKRAIARCNDLVTTYKNRVEKYEVTFDQGQTPNRLSEAVMAIRWRFEEKEALEKFCEETQGLIQSLQMLIVTANITLLEVNRTEVNDKLDEAKRRNETITSSNDAALQNIVDRIESANHNIETGNSMLGKLSEMLRLDWVPQLGSELKGLIRGAIALNFATYRAIIRLESAFTGQLERRLTEEPMMLEDPVGRITQVDLQRITSWDAFNSMLEENFYDKQGYRKVKRREYGLQVRSTGEEVEQSRPWQFAFLPGQHIEMSFIFKEDGADESSCTTCPRCRTPSAHSSDADIQCKKCQIWFRRITAVQDEELLLQATLSPDGQHTQGPILRSESTVTRSRKRSFCSVTEDDDEDLTSFKRVRLVSQRKRATKAQQLAPSRIDHKFKIEEDGMVTTRMMNETEVAELRVLQKLLDQHEAKIAARTLAEGDRKATEQAKKDADAAKIARLEKLVAVDEKVHDKKRRDAEAERRDAEAERRDAEAAKFNRLERILVSQQEAKIEKEKARDAAAAAK